MSCKYCRREKALHIENISTNEKYNDSTFNVTIYEDGLYIESKDLPADGLGIDVNYCPMCGEELDKKNRLSKTLGYRNYTHLMTELNGFSDLELRATHYYFKSNGIEDLLD